MSTPTTMSVFDQQSIESQTVINAFKMHADKEGPIDALDKGNCEDYDIGALWLHNLIERCDTCEMNLSDSSNTHTSIADHKRWFTNKPIKLCNKDRLKNQKGRFCVHCSRSISNEATLKAKRTIEKKRVTVCTFCKNTIYCNSNDYYTVDENGKVTINYPKPIQG